MLTGLAGGAYNFHDKAYSIFTLYSHTYMRSAPSPRPSSPILLQTDGRRFNDSAFTPRGRQPGIGPFGHVKNTSLYVFLIFVSWDAPVSPGNWLRHPNRSGGWCLTAGSVHTHRSKETGELVLKMSQPTKKKRWESNADPCCLRVWVREAESQNFSHPQLETTGERS